jgi:hypothetical protein
MGLLYHQLESILKLDIQSQWFYKSKTFLVQKFQILLGSGMMISVT